MFKDWSLLTMRVVTGSLLAGHGAQKLFGAFGGGGMEQTKGMMQGLGLRPHKHWAGLAGGSEFAGGLLTALGLGGPLGPITMLGPMGIAIGKVHWGKPIWNMNGGAELPLTNVAVATALALSGPGAISLDYVLGIRVPKALPWLALAGVVGGVAYAVTRKPPSQQQQQRAGEKLQDESKASEPERLRPTA